MASTKTSALTALTGANVATGDKYIVLDISDTTQGAGGTLKTHTQSEMLTAMSIGRGALVTMTTDLTAQNYSGAATALAFNSETGGYDTDSIHDTVTNNTRLTVPTGVTKVRLTGNAQLNLVTAGNWLAVAITKNGADAIGLPKQYLNMSDVATNPASNLTSAILTVVATDYFELTVQCQDASITVLATSWFHMQIVK